MKHIHFLGIGGSGASAAAALAEAQGFEVTGCDLEPNNEFTTKFEEFQLLKGHNPSHLENVDILAITPAITSLDPDNPELLQAKRLSIPIMTWQQFVGEYLTKGKFVIAVCGTHGKTTTTAMIAQILEDSNLDPTVLLGAIHPKWKSNFKVGKSKFFVIEADEFNDNFLHFRSDITVVTNIEMDHPEYFKDFKHYRESFKKFLSQTKETVIDQPKNRIDFSLQIPGQFNKLNASQAFEVGLLLDIDPKVIRQSLQNYTGVGRRFEYLGDFNGAKIYSDFGHHPTEIKVTMQAAREKFPKQRLILIYEPHMFSRTKALFNDFVKVFREIPVDKTIITDIYPSREIDTGLVTSQQLVDAVGSNSLVYHTKNELLPMLKHHIKDGNIIFFMGAGDIDKYARGLLS